MKSKPTVLTQLIFFTIIFSSFPIGLPLLFTSTLQAQTLPLRQSTLPDALSNISTRQLIEELRSPQQNRRNTILSELKQRGNNAIPELITALSINDPLVQSGALITLGELGENAKSAVPAIVALLSDRRRALVTVSEDIDPIRIIAITPPSLYQPREPLRLPKRTTPSMPDNLRQSIQLYAIGAIGQIGPAARNNASRPIAALMNNGDPIVQLTATWAIAQMEVEIPWFPTLIKILIHPDLAVRKSASQLSRQTMDLVAKAIGAEGTPTQIEQLILLLSDSDSEIRSNAKNLLKTFGTDAIPALTLALSNSQPAIRLESLKTLQLLGSSAYSVIPSILPLLKDRSSVQFFSPLPVSSYSFLNKPFIDSFEYGGLELSNERTLINIAALQTILKLSESQVNIRAIEAIRPLLKDRDPQVRINAAWGLTRMGVSVSTSPIYLEALRYPETQSEAFRILKLERERNSQSTIIPINLSEINIETLLGLLNNPQNEIRENASYLLRNANAENVTILTRALQSTYPLVRLEAAKALGTIGNAAAPAAADLVALLQDSGQFSPDPSMTGDSLFPSMPSLSFANPYRKSSTLLNGPTLLNWSALNPKLLVRLEAVVAIGKLGEPTFMLSNPALSASLQTLLKKDPSPWVRLSTIWTWLRLNGDRNLVVNDLQVLMTDRDYAIKSSTVSLLEQMGPSGTLLLVNHYLSNLDSIETRQQSVLALGTESLGTASLIAIPKLRPYLESEDKTLRGYTVTILANIAGNAVRAMNSNQLSSEQRQQTIAELTQVLEVLQRPTATFNREPIDRLINAVDRLKK